MCALMIAKYMPSDAFTYLHPHLFIVNFIDLLYINQCTQQILCTYYLLTLCAPISQFWTLAKLLDSKSYL